MTNLLQLELPSDLSKETLWVKQLKERLAAAPADKGDRLSYTMKMTRVRHARLLKACKDHGITLTDLLTDYIDSVLPVLQKAQPVDVPGYKKDHRTSPRRP